MIKSFTFENFKSFEKAELDIEALTKLNSQLSSVINEHTFKILKHSSHEHLFLSSMS